MLQQVTSMSLHWKPSNAWDVSFRLIWMHSKITCRTYPMTNSKVRSVTTSTQLQPPHHPIPHPSPTPGIFIKILSFSPGTIKFHKINHWAESIREFGHPSAYNAETWESAHKWFVKRWMGRMQYNRTGSIKMVMRRNNVAEIHRGSTVLQPGKRARRDYDVFKRVDGSPGFFHQFYFGQSGFWIHCRDSVLFGDDSNVNGLRPGRLESIHKTTDNVIILTIWLYTKAPPQSTTHHPLDVVCTRYALIAGPNKLVKIRPVEDDISVWPLAIQPDMDDRQNFFYECPWIDIVLWNSPNWIGKCISGLF